MNQEIVGVHETDENGNPAGGETTGTGIKIDWQNGPLGRHTENCKQEAGCGVDCTRKAPNGAFVEGVIAAAIDRIKFYQDSKFKCRENAIAITKLEEALHWCNHRTANREERKVEGEHKV